LGEGAGMGRKKEALLEPEQGWCDDVLDKSCTITSCRKKDKRTGSAKTTAEGNKMKPPQGLEGSQTQRGA